MSDIGPVSFYMISKGRDQRFLWYWHDKDCEEPMGPFESRAEAVTDYRALRAVHGPLGRVLGSDEFMELPR